MSRKWIEVTKN